MASQYDLPYTGPQVETLLAKISELESEMPSKTSDLTNDSGFITSEDVPTKTSDLNNDSGFITNAPVAAEAARAQAAEALLATIASLQAEITRATGVEGTLQGLIDGIEAKIPLAASGSNQLADKSYVNASIATASATFRGTYISLVALQSVAADENDYGYVISTDSVGNTIYNRYKYANSTWTFEYAIANPVFDGSQWAAINSAVTAELVAKLSALPDNATLTAALAAKQDVIDDLSSIRSKANSAYQKPSGGIPASDIADGVIPDIADNLTTNDATKVLSAKQGKVLSEQVTQLDQQVSGITSGEYILDSSKYTIGILYRGRVVAGDYSIATIDVQKARTDILWYAKTGFRIGIHFFDSDGNFSEQTPWGTEWRVTKGRSYRVVISSTNGDVLADVSTFSKGAAFTETYTENDSANLQIFGKLKKTNVAVAGVSDGPSRLFYPTVMIVKIPKGTPFTITLSGVISSMVFYALDINQTQTRLNKATGENFYVAPFDIEGITYYYTAAQAQRSGEYSFEVSIPSYFENIKNTVVGSGEVEYYGEKIPSLTLQDNRFYCASETLVSENMGASDNYRTSGMVVYGGKAFCFTDMMDSNSYCTIFDLGTKTQIARVSLPWSAHNNNAQPTPYFYDPGDEYPLFLISYGNYSGGEQKFIFVRVVESGGVYTFTVVKEVTYSNFIGESYNCSWFANYEKNELFAYTFPNGSWRVYENNPIIIYKFDFPSLDNYDPVSLTGADIKGTIVLHDHWVTQSALYHNGKIFMEVEAEGSFPSVTINGVPYDTSKGRNLLFVINATSGYIETIVPLHGGIEQEGLSIYDGEMYVSEKYGSAASGAVCFRLVKYSF